MRPAALVLLAIVAALVMMGSATATWAVVSVPVPDIDGVQLPDRTEDVSGAAESSAGVAAAAIAFLVALPLGLIGPADRLDTRAAGTAARAVATGLAVVAAVLSVMAILGRPSVEVVVLGDAVPTITPTPAVAFFGLAALVLLGIALSGWRIPRAAASEQGEALARYTVEAVQGEGPTVDADGEVDEWDLADAETDTPSSSSEDTR